MSILIARLLVALALLGAHPPDQCPGAGADDGPPRPPKQAIEACAGKAAGDSCSFSGREGEAVSGTCFTPATDKPLACRPAHPPG